MIDGVSHRGDHTSHWRDPTTAHSHTKTHQKSTHGLSIRLHKGQALKFLFEAGTLILYTSSRHQWTAGTSGGVFDYVDELMIV